MANGILEMRGTIDINQFWPNGTSDADTAKIKVENDSFRFRESPDKPFKVTHVFENVIVVGKARKAPINNNGEVTVRLQGIDATELHYRPPALIKKTLQSATQRKLYLEWNLEYRQHLAETAVIALHDLLADANQNPLACKVISLVDTPNEVFDTYGRFVGDILVEMNNTEININNWLIEKGWAFPTFYNSMTNEEITTKLELAKQAKNRGMWPSLRKKTNGFEWDLEFRKKGSAPNPQKDRGKVIMPKLFRRQSTHQVNKRSKMFTGSFLKYLKKYKDDLHLLPDFLEQGPTAAEIKYLDEFINGNNFNASPNDLVFREMPADLRRTDGGEVNW
jgi:endonuclease YncB( thermonuclease family)